MSGEYERERASRERGVFGQQDGDGGVQVSGSGTLLGRTWRGRKTSWMKGSRPSVQSSMGESRWRLRAV